MPSITPNLRLSITNRETNKPFLNWRLGIDGPDDSNMIKLDKAWGDMKTMVDGAMAAVGHAYTAATVADMTDHDKSYVYVGSETGYTNGNWYYWNEDQSAWVSGGVYNATALQTDDTLTLEGEAADAKATGEMIVINGTSSNGTRINITTTNEDVVIPTMDDVDDLKTQLNDYYNVPVSDIRRGVWRQTGIVSSTTRLCCITPFDVKENDIIKYRTINQFIGFTLYNDDFSEMLYDTGWQSAVNEEREFIIPSNGKLIFNARSIVSDSTVITVEDWDSTVIIYNTLIGHIKSELYDNEKQINEIENNITDIFNLESTNTENILNNSVRGTAYSGAVGDVYSTISNVRRCSLIPPFKNDFNAIADIVINEGYRISYRIINDLDIIEYDSGWITSSMKINIDKNKRYAFTGSKYPESTITIEEYINNVSITLTAEFFGIIDGLNDNKIYSEPLYMYNLKAVNHRGYNSIAPENTIPAFILSKKMGFKYVETDVRFTSDGVPVLLHDTTINRTARNLDGSAISETINIASITYAETLNYDFGIYKGTEYAGTKIPTLDEFVLLCKNIGLTPRIELNVLTVANAETMYDVIEKYGMQKKVEYNCNNMDVARKFLEKEPCAVIVYGMGAYTASTVDDIGTLKTLNNTIIINMQNSGYNNEFIEKCKEYKIEAEVWTVDTLSTIQNLLSAYPYITGVTSNVLNISKIMFEATMI